jgi:hypothetical protein
MGVGFRLLWPQDMEWKADEIYSVEQARAILETGAWPAAGMSTSVGPPNPGLSLWAFVPLVALGQTPVRVCLLVMLLNTIALLGFARLAARPAATDPASRAEPRATRLAPREAWLWAIAFMAVNPYVVRIARKIWPPSLLAPLLLLFAWSHSRRNTRAGAFLWGAAGSAMTQIHLSGAFLAAGVLILTAFAQLRRNDPRPTRWLSWTTGTALASLGLIPWFLWMREHPAPAPVLGWSLESFYLRITLCYQYLAELALGLTTRFSYGSDQLAFLSGPDILGNPTHLLGILHLALFFLGGFVLAAAALRLLLRSLPPPWRSRLGSAARTFRRWSIRELPAPARNPLRSAWTLGRSLLFPRGRQPILIDPSARFFILAAALAGPACLILACRIIHMHYVYIFIPFLFLALIPCCRRRRRILALILLLQAGLTLATLVDLHQHGGTRAGDYGRSYRAQGL